MLIGSSNRRKNSWGWDFFELKLRVGLQETNNFFRPHAGTDGEHISILLKYDLHFYAQTCDKLNNYLQCIYR